jgi:Rod binding domain-containing protein
MDIQSSLDFSSFGSLRAQAQREHEARRAAAMAGQDAAPANAGKGDKASVSGNSLAASQAGDKTALRKAAEQFEALFIQEMLKTMRQTVEKDENTTSAHMETYESMLDRELALQMSKRGTVGVADMLVAHLERQQQSTEQLLKNRDLNALRDEARGQPGKGLPLESAMPSPVLPMPSETLRSLDKGLRRPDNFALPIEKAFRPLRPGS